MISSGIVIDDPWITLILQGEKTWEMRTTRTSVRGRIGLIRKGSGQIVGTAAICDCLGPFDRAEIIATVDHHRISQDLIRSGKVDKWRYAWVIADVLPFRSPVSYLHPTGAVIWVRFDQEVSKRITHESDLGKNLQLAENDEQDRSELETLPSAMPASHRAETRTRPPDSNNRRNNVVPYAKDGSFFGPHLGERGYFQVGAKGEEIKHKNFDEALTALQAMTTARWRRPNDKGNWGIVTAKFWKKIV